MAGANFITRSKGGVAALTRFFCWVEMKRGVYRRSSFFETI